MQKKFIALIIALICIFSLTIPALAYSEYTTPSTSGYTSPYTTPSGNYTNPGYTPGSQTGNPYTPGVSSGGWMPGSGSGGYGSGYTPSSLPGSNPYGSGGSGGPGGSAGDHFGVSFSGGDISISLPGAASAPTGGASSAFAVIFQKYKSIGVAIIGICVITAIICLLVQITKLGAAGDNERMRASALKGIIYCGAVIAAFGSLALVVGMFWNAFI